MHILTHTTELTAKNSTDDRAHPQCLDCLFWYRCKLGQIDCDLKGV